MDPPTLAYYDRHASLLAARDAASTSAGSPLPGVSRYFPLAFPPGSRILDVGAGTGRDAALLASLGHDVRAVEPSSELRALAASRHGELRERISPGFLPDSLPDAPSLGGPFDGILCSAVLQHLPRHALFDAVFALRGLTRPHGRVLVSVPSGSGGRTLDAEHRDPDGRLYTPIIAGELQLLFERCGFATLGTFRDPDSLSRPGIEWTTLLFELEASQGSRPLDLVEGILSRREKKVATYKLALFRALCEIALTQPRLASWVPPDRVAVPLEAIAVRWVRYYWPLFDARQFLPQMNGELEARTHRLGFARELEALIAACRRGGVRRYVVQERNGTLDAVTARLRSRLLRKLRHVIREGPATYAGGSLERGRVFEHDEGAVYLDGDLWRELALTGHWIQDAIVLRWAELTSRLSSGEVLAGDVVTQLLSDEQPLRDTDDARDIFAGQPGLRCVWTGEALSKARFAVDHVLPFSLWRSNDLWNLLPSAPAVNNRKSDRLPERRFLLGRRASVTTCWELARERIPARFEREASGLAGTSGASLDVLFDALVEAVEVTAMQRGAARWAP